MTAVTIHAQTIIHERPWQEWLKLAKRYSVKIHDQNAVLHFIEKFRQSELMLVRLLKNEMPVDTEQGLLEDEIKFRQLLDSKFPHRSQWYRDEFKKVFRR